MTPLGQAARVACVFLENTRQTRKNQAYAVFYELATQTAARLLKGQSTALSALNLQAGIAPNIAKEPSGWLSPLWLRLTRDEPQWQEGLVETARRLGYSHTPRLSKVSGSPALYAIEPVEIPLTAPAEPIQPPPPGGLRYSAAAMTAPAAWLIAAHRSGVVRWTFALRFALLGPLFLLLTSALLIAWLAITAGFQLNRPVSPSDLAIGAGISVTGWALVRTLKFLDSLFVLRIVMAPDLLTTLTDANVTLEVRAGSGTDEATELAFVRYTAACPVCDGTVVVEDGRAAYPDRLVGRCTRSAREHVFSFDHVSRVGRPLR